MENSEKSGQCPQNLISKHTPMQTKLKGGISLDEIDNVIPLQGNNLEEKPNILQRTDY